MFLASCYDVPYALKWALFFVFAVFLALVFVCLFVGFLLICFFLFCFFVFCFAFVYLPYSITLRCMLILWIMFTFHFVTLFISFQIQYYVKVLIKFKQNEVFNVEKTLQICIYSDED